MAARADVRLARLLGGEAAGDLAGFVVTGRELGRRLDERRRTAFPTGLVALDELLSAGGVEPAGLPRGRLVELVGRASSGRFAAALATLAAATRAGEAAALVDLGDHLDPEALAAAGADPDRLLWARPRDVGEALAAAEAIVTGGLPLVVVDLGLPPLPGGRGAEAAWLRLARAADAHGAALLVSAPYRVTGTAAHAVVAAEPATGLYAAPPGAPGPTLLQGVALRLTLEKLRGHRPGATATTELVFPQAHPETGLVPSRRQAIPEAVVHVFPTAIEKNDEGEISRPQPPPRPLATPASIPSSSPPQAEERAVLRSGGGRGREARSRRSAPSDAGHARSRAGGVQARALPHPALCESRFPTAAPAAGPGTLAPTPSSSPLSSQADGRAVPGAAGAAAGKLGAGAAHEPAQGTPDRAPAEHEREPSPLPHFASAGSRPQPPGTPAPIPSSSSPPQAEERAVPRSGGGRGREARSRRSAPSDAGHARSRAGGVQARASSHPALCESRFPAAAPAAGPGTPAPIHASI